MIYNGLAPNAAGYLRACKGIGLLVTNIHTVSIDTDVRISSNK